MRGNFSFRVVYSSSNFEKFNSDDSSEQPHERQPEAPFEDTLLEIVVTDCL
ncbi:hypothetical protein SAMN05216386_0590 [Nitrosospira briensis]|uniref:Uncharacterized protein n=1 Tax=Nitrosospira briensis TaxID=35799 RepID=A0A1I4Y9Y6_9PROT|nr:hypothetical protein SAMN05216386_0590 [Nitrosospira briensis]